MQATWNGQTIAASERTQDVGGYIYFPREAVRMERLRASPKTGSDNACPHGVQFYDLVDGAKTAARAAWSYEKPQASRAGVDQWVGFWQDVTVG